MKMLPVYSKQTNNTKPINAIVYYATPQNKNYTGEEDEEKIASIISMSHGVAGHNIEYLFRITDFMREYLPNEDENHLYKIDRIVRSKIGLQPYNIFPWITLVKKGYFKRIIGIKDQNSRYENRSKQPAVTA